MDRLLMIKRISQVMITAICVVVVHHMKSVAWISIHEL